MKCFGEKVRSLHCKIVLLDEQQLVHEVHVNTTGQDLLNVVFHHLNLVETAYFGLRFVDTSRQSQWLDPNKKVLHQLKGGGPHTMYFAVKFYAADPCKLLEELTRYQFFLQIKQDVLQGRLPVSTDLAAELAALAIQSELGDYDPQRHKLGYVSEFRFLAHQSSDLETKIAELHKTMRGLVPAVAEMRYLDKVKWLDLYGVDLHPVLGEDTVEYFLGLTPSGIIVLRNKTKVGNYFWPRISKVYFKRRYFMLRIKDKNNDENTYGFETPSKEACKSLYKCCSQHLAFFRLVQMSGPTTSRFFNLSSRSSSGHQFNHSRSPPQFRRIPSRRQQRRVVDGASDPSQVDEFNNSDSDKTLDAASTTLLSPYHPNTVESSASQCNEQWAETSIISASRSHRSRSHSRNRRDRRSSSVESRCSNDSRSRRRHKHRTKSRHVSDNESEVSRVSDNSHSSRRRRHRSRDSSGSESDHSHRSHRRHRRNSQGSTYELVDSEAQWREIQERQGQIVSSTTPTNLLPPVQRATVRKASDATTSVISSKDLSIDKNPYPDSNLNGIETASEASSRLRQHRKHHHRHHKHRSHSHDKSSSKRPLPAEIMPHLHFELLDPPEGLSSEQLREIPYQIVPTNPKLSSGPIISSKEDTTTNTLTDSNSRKRHRTPRITTTYPEERKMLPVDNDSPPPPYSPPHSVDSLTQGMSSINLNKSRTVDNSTGNIPLATRPQPLSPSSSSSPLQASFPPVQSTPYLSVYPNNNKMTLNNTTTSTSPSYSTGHHMMGGYYGANLQYQTNLQPVTTHSPQGILNNTLNFQYPTTNSSAPSPHNVGLPSTGFTSHHSPNPPLIQVGTTPATGSLGPPMTLPRASVSTTGSNQLDKTKGPLPLSPLANGVTVTNKPTQKDTILRQTKYFTRPQTPVTPKTQIGVNSNPIINDHKPHINQMESLLTRDKFAIQPQPSFIFPDVDNLTTWHSSLPRLLKQPTDSKTGTAMSTDTTLPGQEKDITIKETRHRRASSLELILSPMVQSTLQRPKNTT